MGFLHDFIFVIKNSIYTAKLIQFRVLLQKLLHVTQLKITSVE